MRFHRTGPVEFGRVDFQPILRQTLADESGAANVADGFGMLADGGAVGDLDDGAFGVAV